MGQKALAYAFTAVSLITLTHPNETDFKYILKLSEEQKKKFVDAHNHFRRLVNPEAANMRLMTWDGELAESSEDFVRKCSFSHTPSSGRVTSSFTAIGENLYAGSATFSDIMTENGVTKDWFNEYKFYDYASPSCLPEKMCGHYKQVIWANTYKLGCAISKCAAIEEGHAPILVACHYGPGGNVYDRGKEYKPYIEGPPCSQCGKEDLCIDKLCSNVVRDAPRTTTTGPPTTVTFNCNGRNCDTTDSCTSSSGGNKTCTCDGYVLNPDTNMCESAGKSMKYDKWLCMLFIAVSVSISSL